MFCAMGLTESVDYTIVITNINGVLKCVGLDAFCTHLIPAISANRLQSAKICTREIFVTRVYIGGLWTFFVRFPALSLLRYFKPVN